MKNIIETTALEKKRNKRMNASKGPPSELIENHRRYEYNKREIVFIASGNRSKAIEKKTWINVIICIFSGYISVSIDKKYLSIDSHIKVLKLITFAI